MKNRNNIEIGEIVELRSDGGCYKVLSRLVYGGKLRYSVKHIRCGDIHWVDFDDIIKISK